MCKEQLRSDAQWANDASVEVDADDSIELDNLASENLWRIPSSQYCAAVLPWS